MRSDLTQEEVVHYRDDGFVVLEDFLDPKELDDWRSAFDEAVLLRGKDKVPRGEEDWPESPIFKQIMQLWMDNERMKALLHDERIGRMAADLAGVDGVRIWHDQALTKMPWANPTSWHQDNPKWSFTSDAAISIWIALDDVTAHNGCMYFLPGSQNGRYKEVPVKAPMSEIFTVNPELAGISPVPAPMQAGSCSFHNGLTVHGAGANMTPGYRRAMTCAFMPDGSTFNGIRNVLPESYFNSLRIGDVLNNSAQNPLIFKKSQ